VTRLCLAQDIHSQDSLRNTLLLNYREYLIKKAFIDYCRFFTFRRVFETEVANRAQKLRFQQEVPMQSLNPCRSVHLCA
jgi:hypothetical protein